MFLALAQKVLDYLTRTNDQKNVPKIALRLVEHFYYKVGTRHRAGGQLFVKQQQISPRIPHLPSSVSRPLDFLADHPGVRRHAQADAAAAAAAAAGRVLPR